MASLKHVVAQIWQRSAHARISVPSSCIASNLHSILVFVGTSENGEGLRRVYFEENCIKYLKNAGILQMRI